MKTITTIIYSAVAVLAFACLALSPQARAVCEDACDLLRHSTAHGEEALSNNNIGGFNTANGYWALLSNTDGSRNTATGAGALQSNTTGYDNTAGGAAALAANTTGSFNTASGQNALWANKVGDYNTAGGDSALANNTSGKHNTANGALALNINATGSFNMASGDSALLNNNGSNNVGLGFNAGKNLTTGSGNVCIGAGILGVPGESNTTRIRNVYASIATTRAVYIDGNNKIGTLASSRRFKEEIKPMDKASETLFALKPVTFRYKREVDAERVLSFGLIAEDVAKVGPELITRDEKGNPETVRYEAVNAMLLNEFLKEHRKVEQQDRRLEQQETIIAKQQKQIEALVAGLQKVSVQLELRKPAPETVLNNQ
jgi:hypothetical protein